MKIKILIISIISPFLLFSQQWVDTLYTIQTDTNIIYGNAVDFAGANQTLKMDITYPTNDVPSNCGRPLLFMIHGGGWFAGDKAEGYPKRIREDFARRGYTSASINYRLGLFNTNNPINCNVPDWNCWNMTDTSEWYRANHRAVQDAYGALRYLVNNASTYNIDPNQIFVVGESAGGFVAMSLGFLDDNSEVLTSQTGAKTNAAKPNSIYENNCIIKYNLASSINAMNNARPDLGSYTGTLNLPSNQNYKIKAVGNFYGGVFNNIFKTFKNSAPALYLYHQPCDLIVPYNRAKVLAGYNNCFQGFPAYCQSIVNRPYVYGSKGIKNLIDTMVANNIPTTNYLFDNTNNNYNCLQQTNPAMGCHAIDNYWLRTKNMATFFAHYIDSCTSTGLNEILISNNYQIFPNPTNESFTLKTENILRNANVMIINIYGENVKTISINSIETKIDVKDLSKGIYILELKANGFKSIKKMIVN